MKNKIDFKYGFELAFNNAKAHFRAAEMLSNSINYGIANSHLILASEEAIKAYMIYTKYYDSDIEIKDFNKYFEDHKYKHQTIRDMTFGLKFLRKIIMISLKPMIKLVQTSKKKYTSDQLREKRKEGIRNVVNFLKTLPHIDHNEQWWNQANNNKNRGFYVNIIGNTWQFPDEITEAEYNKSYKIVKEIMNLLSKIPDVGNDPEVLAFYNKLKEDSIGNKLDS